VTPFGATPVGTLAGAAFTLLLVIACVSDVRTRRIPNSLVITLAAGGGVYALATMSPLAALWHAGAGAVIGLALWLPFWAAQVLGAGDVKLVGAAGAWLGAVGVVEASLVGAVAGGGLALWSLIRHGGLVAGANRLGVWMLMTRVNRQIAPELTPREQRIPYGLAIAAGAAAAAWNPGLLW
jgi:prepilin peptidase CpaA